MTVIDALSGALLLSGGLACLSGALGLFRLPDLPARLQAATKPQTLGLVLVLLGAALRVPVDGAAMLVLVIAFQLGTAPVISQVAGRSAHRSGGRDEDSLLVDERTDDPGENGTHPDER